MEWDKLSIGRVRVKQHRIGHAVAVFAEAAYGNIHVQADVIVHHAEGHRAGRAVFIAGDFLGVEEVHALIYPGLTAKGEAVEGGFQNGSHLMLPSKQSRTAAR